LPGRKRNLLYAHKQCSLLTPVGLGETRSIPYTRLGEL
jgi:hypothetical protein